MTFGMLRKFASKRILGKCYFNYESEHTHTQNRINQDSKYN